METKEELIGRLVAAYGADTPAPQTTGVLVLIANVLIDIRDALLNPMGKVDANGKVTPWGE